MKRRRARAEDGATAVEFALIVPFFMLVVFGIIQYGMYFNDSLNLRQGVRHTVREGVVKNFPACGSESTDLGKLKCNTKLAIGALSGDPRIKVKVANDLVPAPAEVWTKGNALVVCAMLQSDGIIGYLPMPSGGIIQTKTRMSIEVDASPATGTPSVQDAPIAGTDWSWC